MSTTWELTCDKCGYSDCWDVELDLGAYHNRETTLYQMIESQRDPNGGLREFYGWVCDVNRDLCEKCVNEAEEKFDD